LAIRKLAPVQKPPTKPTPRVTPDPIDPHRHYERVVKNLAADQGVDARQLADEFWWRACCRWYAGDDLGSAEALALADIEERYERRRRAA
jgi:hypothetical protein